MTVMAGRVCVTLDLSGHVTHWYRYYTVGKVWRAACGAAVSEYEDQHRAIRNPRKLRIKCAGCLALLVAELAEASERNNLWEVLFHGKE
jgi:hypothetical protein